jgi:hypothetical protein
MLKHITRWRNRRDAFRDMEEHAASREGEDNARSTPPPEEDIRVHSIWMMECFTPSTIAGLLRGLEKTGLDQDPISWASDHKPLAWVLRSRTGVWGGWTKVGRFSRIATPWSIRGPLPTGTSGVDLELHSVAPSVTVLIARFDLDDDLSNSLNVAMRRRYRARIVKRPKRGTITEEPVDTVKLEAIRDARLALHRRCAGWMAENFPGVFARQPSSKKTHPAWTFISLTQATPFPPIDQSDVEPYLRILGLGQEIDVWRHDALPGIRIGAPSRDDKQDEMTVAGRWDDLFSEDLLKHRGGKTPHAMSSLLHDELQRTFALWALGSLLRRYQAGVAKLRDELAQSTSRSTRTVRRRLKHLRAQLTSVSLDAQQTTADIRLASKRPWFLRDALPLVPVESRFWEPNTTFHRVLDYREVSEVIEGSEKSLRDLLIAASSLEVAEVNIRIQRAVLLLTIVLAILGVAAIVATLVAAQDSGTIRSLVL